MGLAVLTHLDDNGNAYRRLTPSQVGINKSLVCFRRTTPLPKRKSYKSMETLDSLLHAFVIIGNCVVVARSGVFGEEDKEVQHVHRLKDSMVTSYSPWVFNIKVGFSCTLTLC